MSWYDLDSEKVCLIVHRWGSVQWAPIYPNTDYRNLRKLTEVAVSSPTIVIFNLLGPVLATEEWLLFFLSAKDI